jgi:hypothetical protein
MMFAIHYGREVVCRHIIQRLVAELVAAVANKRLRKLLGAIRGPVFLGVGVVEALAHVMGERPGGQEDGGGYCE